MIAYLQFVKGRVASNFEYRENCFLLTYFVGRERPVDQGGEGSPKDESSEEKLEKSYALGCLIDGEDMVVKHDLKVLPSVYL